MHPIEIAKEAVKQKSAKKFNEKMDEFVHALNHTEEGRKLREKVIPQIAEGIGLYSPLDG